MTAAENTILSSKKLDPAWGIRLYDPGEVERTYIPMRDGVKLYLEVFRPDVDEPFPTILIRTPYHNVNDPPQRRDKECHREFVSRGYAVVEAEVRGTGISEGEFSFLDQDGPDGFDTVSWIGEQSWCDGNIGTMGGSYLGMDQFFLAAEHPPGLKAMFTSFAGANMYNEAAYPGGIMNMLMLRWSISHLAHIVAPKVPGIHRDQEYESLEGMREKVHFARARRVAEHALGGKGIYGGQFLEQIVENDTDSPFWYGKSPGNLFGEIDVPIYCLGGWFDYFIRGTLRSFMEIKAPKKMLIGPWLHGGREGFDLRNVQLRWFDHWLKGKDNGVMEEPPVRIFVLGKDEWRFQESWPPDTLEKRYYLQSEGEMGPGETRGTLEQNPAGDHPPDHIKHDPENPVPTVSGRNSDIRRAEERMLVYTSAKKPGKIEIAGSPVVHLFSSSDREDVDWIAKLTEVRPAGESILLTTGRLRGSHRRSHRDPEPLVPGEIYEFRIELMPVWKAISSDVGLRLDIANSDFPAFYPNLLPSQNLVYHDRKMGSYLSLPVRR